VSGVDEAMVEATSERGDRGWGGTETLCAQWTTA
jgi:hypothetical protein